MIFSSGADSVVVPRAVRINLVLRLIIQWRLPAWPATTRPLAVTLNRFLQLHFGHFRLLSIKVGHYTARHASVAGRAYEPVVYACQPELASPNQTPQRVKLLFRICI